MTTFWLSIVPLILNFPIVKDTIVPPLPFFAVAFFSIAALRKPCGVSQI